MQKERRLVFVVYDGFELLDLAGPISVFDAANALTQRSLYEPIVTSASGQDVTASCGVSVRTKALSRVRFREADTLLVVGAMQRSLINACRSAVLCKALRRAAAKVERYGSVCGGAFLLATSGLLDHKRCTTHWAGTEALQKRFKHTEVDRDALYVVDESLWTSAGVTTGIDMALAMVAADHGNSLKCRIAKWLVVYAHRPGHQSQFSDLLTLQAAGRGDFARLADWLPSVLDQPIKVADLAAKMAMSERTFHRKFTRALGTTPAKFLETFRMDRAKTLLEEGEPVKAVAIRVGFRSESAFRTAFKSHHGVTPSLHASMSGRTSH